MQLARGELPFAYLTLSWNLAQNVTRKPSQGRHKHDCDEEEQEEEGDEAKQQPPALACRPAA